MESLEQQAERTGLSQEFLGDERRTVALAKGSLIDLAFLGTGLLLLSSSISMASQKVPENTIDAIVYAGLAVASAGTLGYSLWNIGRTITHGVLSAVKNDNQIFQGYLKRRYPKTDLLQEVEYGTRG